VASEAKKTVLLSFTPDELAALDEWWKQVGHPNRRAAIRSAIAAAVGRHRAFKQQGRDTAAEPHRWVGSNSTPLTAALHGDD